MGTPDKVREAHQAVAIALGVLERYVESTLRTWSGERGYTFHGRSKSLSSISEKLESGRFSRWSQIDDLYACSVVVPTSNHEDGVIQFLDAAFDRVELRRRNSTQKQPDVFRFDSTRFIGRLKSGMTGSFVPGAGDISFEVQIPTVFEHAWSVATHDLVYKADQVDWRRARLAALLHAAVEQIELVIAGFEANTGYVPRSPHPETDAKQSIVEAFSRFHNEGLITMELVPESWSRFADNVYGLIRKSANRNAAPSKVPVLLHETEKYLRANPLTAELRSGSLFQLVISMVAKGFVPGVDLNSFVVVNSSELLEFHDLETIPVAFEFD